eukprot:evm.model.scf_934EXC.6 EVM.evm.TU.scf_934EXC.6   scf_934EXC:36283-36624(-)
MHELLRQEENTLVINLNAATNQLITVSQVEKQKEWYCKQDCDLPVHPFCCVMSCTPACCWGNRAQSHQYFVLLYASCFVEQIAACCGYGCKLTGCVVVATVGKTQNLAQQTPA